MIRHKFPQRYIGFILYLSLMLMLVTCKQKSKPEELPRQDEQDEAAIAQKKIETDKAQKWLKTIKGKWQIVRLGAINSPGTIDSDEAGMALNKILQINDKDVYFPCHKNNVCHIILLGRVSEKDPVYDRCDISNYTGFKEMTIEKYFQDTFIGHPTTGYNDAEVGKSVKANDKVREISAEKCDSNFAGTIVILPNNELMYEAGGALFYMRKIR